MPNLLHEPSLPADLVGAHLASVLPLSQLTYATVDAGYQALLLLQTKHVMAAFAFSNGDVSKSFDNLYQGFKRLYSTNQKEWNALDLAFVFCVNPNVSDLDRVCSRIETDVYFCRKFVVPLADPIGLALARLPFLPLTRHDGGVYRPPSAQTLLQQCGLPALFAKYLVVRHARGPEGIVDDCTSGKFGEPGQLIMTTNASVAKSGEEAEATRVDEVIIENFRAYRKPQRFVLGSDVTVLYGPNGFGKTSFFDAVDFAMTGGIARLATADEIHFAKVARHLDSKPSEGSVALVVSQKGDRHTVTRTVHNHSHATIDSRSMDRKALLAELTGGPSPSTDRVDNFVSLFRATHLFSQEMQELTKGFREQCCLSAEVVSRMLAFEDYTNALAKIAKVRERIDSIISRAVTEIAVTTQQINQAKNELDRLSQLAQRHANTESLDSELEVIRVQLTLAGCDVETGRPDVATVRGWRAWVESRRAESQHLTARLSALVQDVTAMVSLRADSANLQKRFIDNESQMDQANKQLASSSTLLRDAERRLSESTANGVEAELQIANLQWVRSVKPLHIQLVERQRLFARERDSAVRELSAHRETEELAANKVRALGQRATDISSRLAAMRAEVANRAAFWEWIRERLSLRAKLLESQRGLVAEISAADLAVAQAREAVSDGTKALSLRESQTAEAAMQLKNKNDELLVLRQFGQLTSSSHSNQIRVIEVATSKRECQAKLETLRTEERDLRLQVATLSEEEGRASRQLAEIDKNQTELKGLLSELQMHVATGTCPLCGVDHGTRDKLLGRIHDHVDADLASDLRAEVGRRGEATRKTAEFLAMNQTKQESLAIQSAALHAESLRLDDEIARFNGFAARLAFVMGPTSRPIEDQLKARIDAAGDEIASLGRQNRDAIISLDAARIRLATAKRYVETKAAELADRKGDLALIEADLKELQEDPRISQVLTYADFENHAAEEGLRLQNEILDLAKQSEQIAAALSASRAELNAAKSAITSMALEVSNRNVALAGVEGELGLLLGDTHLSLVSLDLSEEQIAIAERLRLDDLTRFKKLQAKSQMETAEGGATVAALTEQVTSLSEERSELRTQITSIEEKQAGILARLQQAGMSAEVEKDALLSSIAAEARKRANLDQLRDTLSQFEGALDAATTAAVLSGIQQNVKDGERLVTEATGRRDIHAPWLKYFDQLSLVISSQQNDAIASFSHEYGPRTAVIQRRLRSVYGFDEIEIKGRGAEIEVRVKRRGEVLRPIDYFSQSQQQTLLLGLFLTACISQTWSGFAPVLLDDPITHFDDLNTYAFLDLIMGLVESEPGKRQFIISTCDHKLYQLARQKFAHLGDRAAFYRFAAIGVDGPTIERMRG